MDPLEVTDRAIVLEEMSTCREKLKSRSAWGRAGIRGSAMERRTKRERVGVGLGDGALGHSDVTKDAGRVRVCTDGSEGRVVQRGSDL